MSEIKDWEDALLCKEILVYMQSHPDTFNKFENVRISHRTDNAQRYFLPSTEQAGIKPKDSESLKAYKIFKLNLGSKLFNQRVAADVLPLLNREIKTHAKTAAGKQYEGYQLVKVMLDPENKYNLSDEAILCKKKIHHVCETIGKALKNKERWTLERIHLDLCGECQELVILYNCLIQLSPKEQNYFQNDIRDMKALIDYLELTDKFKSELRKSGK